MKGFSYRLEPFKLFFLVLSLMSAFVLLSPNIILEGFAQDFDCEIIDDFENTTQLSSPVELTPMNPGPVSIVDNGSPGTLGSFRNITFGPKTGPDQSRIVISGGFFSLANDPSSSAGLTLAYNANGAGLGTDISNAIYIAIEILTNDLPNTDAILTLTDSANNMAQLTMANLPNTFDGDTLPVDLEFPINDFNGINNFDLSNLESIELVLDQELSSVDLAFGAIEICSPVVVIHEVPALSTIGYTALTIIIFFAAIAWLVKTKKFKNNV